VSTVSCCGFPMIYYEVFGIRIYSCAYRGHHDRVFEKDGNRVPEASLAVLDQPAGVTS
jgi:hypothetical protein